VGNKAIRMRKALHSFDPRKMKESKKRSPFLTGSNLCLRFGIDRRSGGEFQIDKMKKWKEGKAPNEIIVGRWLGGRVGVC